VVFSNQKGISTGKQSASDVTGKLIDVFEQARIVHEMELFLTALDRRSSPDFVGDGG